MSMNDINNAAAAQNALTERMNAFVNDADAQVGQVAARYNSHYARVYVDQAIGDDSNAGTAAAPVATIQKAVQLVPMGVTGFVHVRGDYTATGRCSNLGKNICLFGAVGNGDEFNTPANPADRPVLNLPIGTRSGQASVNGFEMDYGALWNVCFFQIQMPAVSDLASDIATLPHSTTTRAMFCSWSSQSSPIGAVILRYCNLTVPADPWGTLVSSHPGAHVELLSMSITGDLAGRVSPMVAAGTPRESVAHLITTTMPTL